MADPASVFLSGNINLDKNGERVFMATRGDAGASVVFRILPAKEDFAVFPETLLFGATLEVSIRAHVASSEEQRSHDQLTRPTFVAERVALADDIRSRAFEIFQTTRNPQSLDNWLKAERELLGVA